MTTDSKQIILRPARASDDAELLELERSSWDSRSGFPSLRAVDRTEFFYDERHRVDIHEVAEYDGAVVGYARLVPVADIAEASHVLLVAGLAVSPSARRLGVGAALIAHMESVARQRGARKLMLYVFSTNAAAIRLYERSGFDVEGRQLKQFYIEGEYVDSVIMAKHLS